MLDVLLLPERWTIFGPYCDPPVEPVDRPGRKAWVPSSSHGPARVEVMMVLRGRGRHRYRGRVHDYWPGTVFCHGPQERREVELPEWAPEVEVLWAHVTGRGLTARLLHCLEGPRGGRLRTGRLLVVEGSGAVGPNPLLYPRFIEESPAPVRPLQVRAGLELLVASIVGLGYESERLPPESPTRQVMRRVADFIQEAGGATDVGECARLAGCSPNHFVRLFRQHHGVYVKGYIDDFRVAQVAELERAGWKQKEIAEYFDTSPSAFSQWYKRARRKRPF
jgi:AraC-like DNA-binding protein